MNWKVSISNSGFYNRYGVIRQHRRPKFFYRRAYLLGSGHSRLELILGRCECHKLHERARRRRITTHDGLSAPWLH